MEMLARLEALLAATLAWASRVAAVLSPDLSSASLEDRPMQADVSRRTHATCSFMSLRVMFLLTVDGGS